MAFYAQTDIRSERKVVKNQGDTVSKSDFPDDWDSLVASGAVAETEPSEVLDNNLIGEVEPPVPADPEATKKAEADAKKLESKGQ